MGCDVKGIQPPLKPLSADCKHKGMMMGLRSARSALAQALFVLASLAFVLRAVVPAGFMIDRDDADGAFEVTICSAHSAQESAIDQAILEAFSGSKTAGGAEHPQNAQDCAFAFAFAAALSQLLIAFLLPSGPQNAALPQLSSDTPAHFAARPPLPARGPPPTLL